MRLRLLSGLGTAFSLALAASAGAVDSGSSMGLASGSVDMTVPHSVGIPVQSFGTASMTRLTVGACDGAARTSAGYVAIERPDCEIAAPAADGLMAIAFPVHVPSGALIESVTMNYFDSTTGSTPGLSVWRISPAGVAEIAVLIQAPDFSGGTNAVTWAVDPPYQVDNDFSYQILVICQRNGAEFEGITRFAVDYQLQVSPAPAVASFGDVPTGHPYFKFVEALVSSGVTVGCGAGNFCPDLALTRGQMAVFLAKALGLHFPN